MISIDWTLELCSLSFIAGMLTTVAVSASVERRYIKKTKKYEQLTKESKEATAKMQDESRERERKMIEDLQAKNEEIVRLVQKLPDDKAEYDAWMNEVMEGL